MIHQNDHMFLGRQLYLSKNIYVRVRLKRNLRWGYIKCCNTFNMHKNKEFGAIIRKLCKYHKKWHYSFH